MNTMTEVQYLSAALTLTDEERQPCEVWTRVMGYHRPVASFNIGKKGEHARALLLPRGPRAQLKPWSGSPPQRCRAMRPCARRCAWAASCRSRRPITPGASLQWCSARVARGAAATVTTRTSCRPPTDRPGHDWRDIVRFLDTRRGLLDAVVLSGGEPTAQEAIVEAIAQLRAMGFGIALHTAGIYPRRLERVLPHVDWIGLDIKAPPSLYPAVTGIARAGAPAFESLDLVCASGVDYEVRTTVHPQLLPLRELESLAQALAARGVRKWMLQPFRPIGCASAALNATAPRGAILDPTWVEALRRHVPGVAVRA